MAPPTCSADSARRARAGTRASPLSPPAGGIAFGQTPAGCLGWQRPGGSVMQGEAGLGGLTWFWGLWPPSCHQGLLHNHQPPPASVCPSLPSAACPMAVATSQLRWLVLLASLVPPGKVPPHQPAAPCIPPAHGPGWDGVGWRWNSQGMEKGQGDRERGKETSSRRAQRANLPFSYW